MSSCYSTFMRLGLRFPCFFIGYVNLIAAIVDLACHLTVVYIITNGFQCDVTEQVLSSLDWGWLESILLVLNLGTHGFYPYPLVFEKDNNVFLNYQRLETEPKCYNGILHVYLIDVLTFLLNIVWLKFVIKYVVAVHKKKLDVMRKFLTISIIKMILHTLHFVYKLEVYRITPNMSLWFLTGVDILSCIILNNLVYMHIKDLTIEKALMNHPPPYVQCLIDNVAYPTKPGIEIEMYSTKHKEIKEEHKTEEKV